MSVRSIFPPAFFLASVPLGACLSRSDDELIERNHGAITSAEATILDFTFGAEVVTNNADAARSAVVAQLLYAQGMLKSASNASGQIGNARISDIVETPQGEKKRIAYKASLPVAWPKDVTAPTTYSLTLPLDVGARAAFNTKYDGRCGKSEGAQDDFWHVFNPSAQGCALEDADVFRATATIAARAAPAPAKYPEYGRIWEDDRLDVVALFGIIEENRSTDWGFREEQRFIDDAQQRLEGASVVKNGTSASVHDDTTLTGKITFDGRARDVKVDTLVVDDFASMGADFDTRYDALTEKADLVLYNGHARHGRNLNALVRKGKVVAGKYQLVLLNGCESFALVDTTLTDRRREVNGASDPEGTKFLDIVSNAQPGKANHLATVSEVVYGAILTRDAPLTYDALVRKMPESHVVVVFGEEDNAFVP
ncbi:MAG TPA: hypothetical protein VM925_21080 [Labilithrix sp.]|nr:hypothetical protein [Labilithrix sp.]